MAPTLTPECAGYLMLRKKLDREHESLLGASCSDGDDWDIGSEHYCVMHSPTKDKTTKFNELIEAKLNEEDYNFRGVWFPEDIDFKGRTFKKEVNFSLATFNGKADFSRTKFDLEDNEVDCEADFRLTVFEEEACFYKAQFVRQEAYFYETHFKGRANFYESHCHKNVYFTNAIFEAELMFAYAAFEKKVFFDFTVFKKTALADFGLANFMDFTRFKEITVKDGAALFFREATFEKPERLQFHFIQDLRPYWFLININTSKFDFENVTLKLPKNSNEFAEELEGVRRVLSVRSTRDPDDETEGTESQPSEKQGAKPSEPPSVLMATVYHRLALNATENGRFVDAMRCRYLAMDLQRRSAWWKRFLPVTLHGWYWASSGYGERALRATFILIAVWLLPFVFYQTRAAVFTSETKLEDVVTWSIREVFMPNPTITPTASPNRPYRTTRSLPLSDAAFYSLNVMAFQKPEPKPAEDSTLTRLIVILQTILGPVQAALLVLAIRRKFMR